MFKNYFITALRTYYITKKAWARSFFTYINLLGLIIGLTAFLIIAHLVRYELSYDRFFPNAPSVYRVMVQKTENGRTTMQSVKTWPGTGNLLKTAVPGINNFTRVLAEECMLMYKEKDIKLNRQHTYWADKSFTSIFGLQFVETGDTATLDKPFNCLLSQSLAKKFFGNYAAEGNTPVGKTIRLNESLPFIVQGVFKDLPANSHMKCDFIVSFATLIHLIGPRFDNSMPPSWNSTYTYISLKAGATAEKLETLAGKVLNNNIPATTAANVHYRFSLQPVTSIHLNSHFTDELNPNGNRVFVVALSLAAILILLVAWINFINLATARSMQRAKEVGIRKTIGSSRRQLVAQFITEALFASIVAAIIAVAIVWIISGTIKNMAGITAPVFSWKGQGIYYWLLFIGIILAGGLLSSIYPALVLSSYNPVQVLKGKAGHTPGKGYLRKSLITFQFFFAVFLLSCTGAVYYQINFMRSRALGLNTQQVIVLHSPRSLIGNPKRIEYFKTFREKLLRYPGIEKIGASACIPGNEFLLHLEGIRQQDSEEGKNQSYDVAWVDEGYLPALGIKLIAGRNFIQQPGEDGNVIPNETALRMLGFKDSTAAIGRNLLMDNKKFRIVGVANDAHYEGLQKNIRPLLLFYGHNYEFGFFSAKLTATNINQTIGIIQNTWKEIYPNDPFDYFFLDSFFDQQYKSDELFGKTFGLFSFLAVFIACLGLIGLVTFTTWQKTKEIGVRKVLGANVISIFGLLTGEFIKPVIIACVVTIPLTHIIISKWLNSFAYRVQFTWWLYIIPILIIILLAVLAISWQSLKAATDNPVNALRV